MATKKTNNNLKAQGVLGAGMLLAGGSGAFSGCVSFFRRRSSFRVSVRMRVVGFVWCLALGVLSSVF